MSIVNALTPAGTPESSPMDVSDAGADAPSKRKLASVGKGEQVQWSDDDELPTTKSGNISHRKGGGVRKASKQDVEDAMKHARVSVSEAAAQAKVTVELAVMGDTRVNVQLGASRVADTAPPAVVEPPPLLLHVEHTTLPVKGVLDEKTSTRSNTARAMAIVPPELLTPEALTNTKELYLMLDESCSMADGVRDKAVKELIPELGKLLTSHEKTVRWKLTIGGFGERAKLKDPDLLRNYKHGMELCDANGRIKGEVHAMLMNLEKHYRPNSPGTNIYDVLVTTANDLDKRKVPASQEVDLLIVTDGEPNQGLVRSGFAQCMPRIFGNRRVTVHVLVIGEAVGVRTAKDLTSFSKGLIAHVSTHSPNMSVALKEEMGNIFSIISATGRSLMLVVKDAPEAVGGNGTRLLRGGPLHIGNPSLRFDLEGGIQKGPCEREAVWRVYHAHDAYGQTEAKACRKDVLYLDTDDMPPLDELRELTPKVLLQELLSEDFEKALRAKQEEKGIHAAAQFASEQEEHMTRSLDAGALSQSRFSRYQAVTRGLSLRAAEVPLGQDEDEDEDEDEDQNVNAQVAYSAPLSDDDNGGGGAGPAYRSLSGAPDSDDEDTGPVWRSANAGASYRTVKKKSSGTPGAGSVAFEAALSQAF